MRSSGGNRALRKAGWPLFAPPLRACVARARAPFLPPFFPVSFPSTSLVATRRCVWHPPPRPSPSKCAPTAWCGKSVCLANSSRANALLAAVPVRAGTARRWAPLCSNASSLTHVRPARAHGAHACARACARAPTSRAAYVRSRVATPLSRAWSLDGCRVALHLNGPAPPRVPALGRCAPPRRFRALRACAGRAGSNSMAGSSTDTAAAARELEVRWNAALGTACKAGADEAPAGLPAGGAGLAHMRRGLGPWLPLVVPTGGGAGHSLARARSRSFCVRRLRADGLRC